MVTVTAILVLPFLYGGPLGDYLLDASSGGGTPLAEALLGVFFSTATILVLFAALAWEKSLLVQPGSGAMHTYRAGGVGRCLHLARSVGAGVLGVAESPLCEQ
jgi:hypothetical protein